MVAGGCSRYRGFVASAIILYRPYLTILPYILIVVRVRHEALQQFRLMSFFRRFEHVSCVQGGWRKSWPLGHSIVHQDGWIMKSQGLHCLETSPVQAANHAKPEPDLGAQIT